MTYTKKDTLLKSNYISRDLSWINFNTRVLDQAKNITRNIFERLKFMAITASNLDEFFQIRVGSLYNYIDYGKERIDYSGLREQQFRKTLLSEVQSFYKHQIDYFERSLRPEFRKNGFDIASQEDLNEKDKEGIEDYFMNIVYPMLTPMAYDGYHSFPILVNKMLTLGVITRNPGGGKDNDKKLSFVQVPQNLPRFYTIDKGDIILFMPLEDIIKWHIDKLYRNVELISMTLFRITRNGDFSIEESDDIEEQYIEEITRKLKSRKTARVVRIEAESGYSEWMMKILKERYEIDNLNVFENSSIIDYTCLWQIINHDEFKDNLFVAPVPVKPISFPTYDEEDPFEYLKKNDVLLHQPYNSMQLVLDLLERAAEDPNVLAIKITIYRLAKKSRITNALLKAAENGKHVSVLFEVKARFDEENNIREGQRLQKAGCFVVYGVNRLKTHTKLMMIVRKEDKGKVTRYVHMSSGNYNEDTARLYTDISLLTTNEIYAHDVNEFFNAITGHSMPEKYSYLITAPGNMRQRLIELINQEAENARKGLPAGIVIKVNSLQDLAIIDAFYQASNAGVPIKLIVRGMCCLRPGRKNLSENIYVKSIVGNFLEHGRLYYFHNNGDPLVYGGSADMMVRSFDRRIESLFLITDPLLKQEAINILDYNLKDNVNSYVLLEDGTYVKIAPSKDEAEFDTHVEFFKVKKNTVLKAKLFDFENKPTADTSAKKKTTRKKKNILTEKLNTENE
ncbi:MAG: polyphosphate kinase 1 [Cytophagaceae bacterium]|nr:polyphosphate kinase 1 [Cytophagaceae bacterium]MDW8455382.1 polyphosphate kinase 1 [Cytophagaceae bacterium]